MVVDKDIDDNERFVWVIPSEDQEAEKFALKTYGQSHFLAFKRNGNPILVPGVETDEEVTIFKFQYQ